MERSFCLFILKFFVISCIFATSIPTDLQLSGDKLLLAFPSKKVTIINFLLLKSVITCSLLFVIGTGHLKLDLFKVVINSEKKGRSFVFTLFS